MGNRTCENCGNEIAENNPYQKQTFWGESDTKDFCSQWCDNDFYGKSNLKVTEEDS